MRIHHSKTWRLLTGLLLMALITGCAPKEEKGPLKIAINVWPGYAHAFIAREKGIFEKNGASVDLLLKRDYSESLELFKQGEADGLFLVFSDVVVLHSEGVKARVVYVADYSDSGDVIIGRPELESLADLKGKAVSFEGFNTFSHMFVLRSLEKAGLGEASLQFRILPALKVLDALESGEIDAGHTWEPVTTQAVAKGYKILGKAGDVPGIITDVLAFSEKAILERPEDIQRAVASLLEARDFIYSNKEEAMSIMARAEEMSVEEMEQGIQGVHQLDAKENMEALSSTLRETGAGIARFYTQRGQLPKKLDFDEILEKRFVERARNP